MASPALQKGESPPYIVKKTSGSFPLRERNEKIWGRISFVHPVLRAQGLVIQQKEGRVGSVEGDETGVTSFWAVGGARRLVLLGKKRGPRN